MDFSFNVTTKIIFKSGKLNNVKSEIEKFIPKKSNVLLCTGMESAKKNGYYNTLIKQLRSYKIIDFSGIQANPLLSKAETGLLEAKKHQIKGLIALGGGSVMDTAKAIATAYSNDVTVKELWEHKVKPWKYALPLIMIPTTSATSSEINQYTVLSHGQKKGGFGLKPYMFPKLALIDPALTLTLPLLEIKATIGDIFAHSLESFWATSSNEFTRFFALEAIRLLLQYAPKNLENMKSIEYREKISLASIYAAFSFSHSGCNVSHMLSYPLTVKHNIRHGLACAVTLLVFYEKFSDAGHLSELNEMLKVNSTLEGKRKLEVFYKASGLPLKISDLGVGKEIIDIMVEEGYPYRNNVLPIKFEKEEMRKIG